MGALGAADADDEMVRLVGALAQDLHVTVVKRLEPAYDKRMAGVV